MKTGWLIYDENDILRNKAYIDWMLTEAKKAGMMLQLITRQQCTIGVTEQQLLIQYNQQACKKPDFAIVRTIDSMFTRQLEALGIQTFNNAFVADICNDKAKTHQYLAPYGIPMLDTLFFGPGQLAQAVIPLSYPYIIKEVHGRGGKQVYRINSEQDEEAILPQINTKSIIVQEYNKVPGKDLRVFVIGKEIIAAVLRSSTSSFKANISLGGHASLYTLSEDEKQLIHSIIDKFDFGLVGLDFMFREEGGLILNEIEDVVGSRSLSATTSINLMELYMTFIHKKVKGAD